MTIDDIKADISWSLIGPLTLTGIYLIDTIIGWKLYGSIIHYLNNKPPGEQQPMDIIHNISYQSARFCILISLPFIFFNFAFVDSGDIIAKILMWPTYLTSATATLIMALNPLLQYILPRIMTDGCSISDNALYFLTNFVLWTPYLIVTAICTPLGIYPPCYFMMRGQEIQNPEFQIAYFLSSSIFFLTAILSLFLGKFSWPKDALKLGCFGCVVVIYIIYIALNLQGFMTIMITSFVCIVFPLLIISSNEKLLNCVKSRQPKFGKLASKLQRTFFPNHDPNPTDTQSNDSHQPESKTEEVYDFYTPVYDLKRLDVKDLSSKVKSQSTNDDMIFHINPPPTPSFENVVDVNSVVKPDVFLVEVVEI